MHRYELTTDQAFYEAVYEYHDRVEIEPFDNSEWLLNTSLCSGNVLNLQLLDGLGISLFDVYTHKPIVFTNHFITPRIIELGFVLSGILENSIQGRRREFDSLEGQNYLAMLEGELSVNTSAAAGQHLKSFEIRFTPESLDQCCFQVGQKLPVHLKHGSRQREIAPHKCASVSTKEMSLLVQEIFGNYQEYQSNPLFLESKCLDLVAHYMTFANGGMPPKLSSLSPRDIERIREARYILTMRMTDPPSLMELARMVNLNDFKLKLGFRQAFGTTAYAYLKELRLQQAQVMLCHQQKSVTETAFSVGYRNIGDFGIAFKRRFGISPRYAHQLKNP